MPDVVVLGGGIAGLVAAYSARRAAAERGSSIDVRVLEAGERPGGQIRSLREDGFLVEAGPDGFVSHKPAARELAIELGLGERLVPANEGAGASAVFVDGRLRRLPPGAGTLMPSRIGPLLRSSLLSPGGWLRFLAERWVPPRREEEDESLSRFVRRRFGRQALDRLAEPVLAHVHAADPERLSMAATYPRLADLERRSGSLLRAAASAPPPRGPVFWSFQGGVGELVDALLADLGGAVSLGRRAVELVERGDGWSVRLDDGTAVYGRAVVLALPAAAAVALLDPLAPLAAANLRHLRAVSVATVSLGFRGVDGRRLPGFGAFVPRLAGRRLLGATWSSRKFPGRAAPGDLLVRAFLGGAFDAAAVELDDDALVALARQELRAVAGLDAEPLLARVFRFPAGYPQADVGHRERIATAEAALPPGLALAGAAFHGVGLPDCVASGRQAARRALAALPESAAS